MDFIQFNIDQITDVLKETTAKFGAVNVPATSDKEKAHEFACIIGTLQAQLDITRRDLRDMQKKKFWQIWK